MECKNRVNCPICRSDESNYITKKTCVLPLLYKELRQCKKCSYQYWVGIDLKQNEHILTPG